jgi:hypothetical protein
MTSAGSLHPKKIALLHVAKRQLALADEDYRAILMRFGGVDSAAELTQSGFELVMYELGRLGFKSTSSKRNFGERPGFASPAQVQLIRKLWADYHGPDEGERALSAWLTRFHHVAALRFVSAEAAANIIPGLKAMVARRQVAR